jgi:hypothetical protein
MGGGAVYFSRLKSAFKKSWTSGSFNFLNKYGVPLATNRP